MSEFTPDKNLILEAILAARISPLAKEEASGLVESWVDRWANEDSTNWQVEAEEMPFFMWLTEEILIVGVSDMRGRDADGNFHGEWKSTRAPKTNDKYHNEETFAEDLNNGPQIAVYALAQREGYFIKKDGKLLHPCEATPRMLVRACVKSDPPVFWPDGGVGFMSAFDDRALSGIRNTLRNEGEAMLARKRTGMTPWAYIGHQCVNKFKRKCDFYEACKRGEWPSYKTGAPFSESDPGAQAIKHALENRPGEFCGQNSAEFVILGASAYSDAQQCPEIYRQRNLCAAPKEESFALDVGTGMHAGVGKFYELMRLHQMSLPG